MLQLALGFVASDALWFGLEDRDAAVRHLRSFPTRRSSDLARTTPSTWSTRRTAAAPSPAWSRFRRTTPRAARRRARRPGQARSEEHTSELQSLRHLVCRLLLEKKKQPARASPAQGTSAETV